MGRTAMPEIAEADATGETAALYAELRAAFGVPVVNYIWRSLAAAGGLGWAWPRVRAWRPALAGAAPRLRAAAAAAIRREGLASVAVPMPPGAADVIRAYERGNSWNLLAVTALLHDAPAPPPSPDVDVDGADRGELPAIAPYPDHDRLPVAQRERIALLAAAGPGRDSGVRPSLWVHLSHWPDVLAAAAARVPAVLGSTAFARAHATLLLEAPTLLGLAPAPAPALAAIPDAPAAVPDTLGAFRGRIAEMVLVGQLLPAREA